MAKVTYKKRIEVKLFGKIKLFTINFDYVEHSRSGDDEEDEFYIDLDDRIIEQNDDEDDQQEIDMGCFLTGDTITKQITTDDGMYIALNNQLSFKGI